jgi:hypothetical protein
MKKLRIIRRFLQGKRLSDKENRILGDFFNNIKIGVLTLLLLIGFLYLLNISGCYESRISDSELKELGHKIP